MGPLTTVLRLPLYISLVSCDEGHGRGYKRSCRSRMTVGVRGDRSYPDIRAVELHAPPAEG